MNQPTLIDVIIALALLGSILGACHRGLGREMLHTVLFTILVAIGYILFRNGAESASPDDTVFWVINSAYYLMTAYVLTWIGMKVMSPIVLGQEQVGLRSRFWAGIICIAKLTMVIGALNLWFAMHTSDAHPKRLNQLPPLVRDSVLIQISDKFTEDFYRWLAAKNIVTYHKVLERAPTEQELEQKRLEESLGLTPTGR